MREIKFRAWNKQRKEMFEVINIDFKEKKVTLKNWIIKISNVDFNDIELMQYTGLKDKNRNKIYEKDLISCNKYKDVIVFLENGCFKVKYLRNPITTVTCSLSSFLEKYKCRITGNVYDYYDLCEEQTFDKNKITISIDII